jgi:DNA-directed RNA polymerase specialized sigma24 family protein
MTCFASTQDGNLGKLKKILARLAPVEREALARFYLLDQDAVRIAAELGINNSQFQELKARIRRTYLATERPN